MKVGYMLKLYASHTKIVKLNKLRLTQLCAL